MKKIRILLVEDDELASELVYNFLLTCNFEVVPVFTATDSISYLKNDNFDILILDINLPDFNGYEVLKSIRNHVSLPVIIASSHNDTESKLLAFRYGASDYMVKPIDLEELEARIWVQLSKNSEIKIDNEKEEIFEIKDTSIFFKKEFLRLTTIEFDILSILIKNKNKIVSREDLLLSLLSISSNRSLDNHIKNIRKKIGDNGSKSIYLKTIYGLGYILEC